METVNICRCHVKVNYQQSLVDGKIGIEHKIISVKAQIKLLVRAAVTTKTLRQKDSNLYD